MPREEFGLGLTFVLACVSAGFFLQLRCEGKGRAFAPRSRPWALSVIGLTGVLSTAGALALALLGRYLPLVVFGLGVIAPSALCLGKIREGAPERRNVYQAAATLWLTRLLARMSEGMAEDRLEWCERHIDPAWHTDELIRAARYYHDYLDERLSAEERRRYRIHSLMHNIEARLDVVLLIDSSAPRTKVVAALNATRLAQEARYRRNLEDLSRLANRLAHDAKRDVERMLATAYNTGLHRLEPYPRPVRPVQPHGEPAGSPRWHP
jgi:hypothetical protein